MMQAHRAWFLHSDLGEAGAESCRPMNGLVKSISRHRVAAVSILSMLAFWHVASTYITPSILFTPPIRTFERFVEMTVSGALWTHVSISIARIVSGFVLGSAIGIILGLFMGNVSVVRAFLEPYINFFRFIPAIAMITIAVLWLGIGEASKIFLILYSSLFIVTINTMVGIMSIERNKIRAAQCLGATRQQMFIYVTLPATMPYILTGMRLAMANAFATIIPAEMLGANAGIGTVIWTARLFMLIEDVFVALIVIGGLGLAADRLFVYFSRKFAGRYGVV